MCLVLLTTGKGRTWIDNNLQRYGHEHLVFLLELTSKCIFLGTSYSNQVEHHQCIAQLHQDTL